MQFVRWNDCWGQTPGSSLDGQSQLFRFVVVPLQRRQRDAEQADMHGSDVFAWIEAGHPELNA